MRQRTPPLLSLDVDGLASEVAGGVALEELRIDQRGGCAAVP